MNKEVLVRVNGVSKKFAKDLKRSMLYGLEDVFTGVFQREMSVDLRKSEFWALKDVSFEVKRGECLGLIGHNGAGKSTLLKMLNGLIRPDVGTIEMHGRVGALIELGAGFNPILSGRENIYNNGAVLGFSKEEIDAKFDEIVAFSEIGDFIDMPVQNYSSGMRVRLGFSVAAQMQPDILLIDEVLAVGDMGFVLKCFNQMDKLLQNTALILVSHGMPHIARMATQILMLEQGRSVYHSHDVAEGITNYYSRFNLNIGDFSGSGDVDLLSLKLVSEGRVFEGDVSPIINYGKDLSIEVSIKCNKPILSPELYLAFYDREQRNFAEVSNFHESLKLDVCNGIMTFCAIIPFLPFSQGKYSISVAFSGLENQAKTFYFRYQSAIYFTVHNPIHGWAPLQFNPEWHLSKIQS
jgi:lipopolysaccharide transport system ATP-binding protein